jgi:single-strand DNA-binding protein
MVNHCVLSGNLGQDPEARYFENSKTKCRFSIGVFKPVGKDKPKETNWITIECWNELAELAKDTLKKGDAVIVVGTWEVETYQTKEGSTNKFNKFVASEIGVKLKPKKVATASMGEQTTAMDSTDIPF